MCVNPHYEVVAAVVTDGERYFCTQRARTRFAYTSEKFEFPGGKIEPGETEPQALQRELHEELDMDVVIERKICTVHHDYPDFSITLAAYQCRLADPHFLLKEHESYRWVKLSELSTLDFAAADRKIIAVLQK